MSCLKPAGPGWQGRASDQFFLTLERTVGSWSELGAVGTHVLLGDAENRHKQWDGTWAQPPTLPWNLPFCVQTPASREQRHCWQAWVQPTIFPTSTGCYCSLSSYLSPQCLGGTENPGPQSHPHPGLLPAGCPPSVWGVGGGPKQYVRGRVPARPLNWAVSPTRASSTPS